MQVQSFDQIFKSYLNYPFLQNIEQQKINEGCVSIEIIEWIQKQLTAQLILLNRCIQEIIIKQKNMFPRIKQNELNGFIGMIKYTLLKKKSSEKKQQVELKQYLTKIKRKKQNQIKTHKRLYKNLFQIQLSNPSNKSMIYSPKKLSFFDIYKQALQKKQSNEKINHLQKNRRTIPFQIIYTPKKDNNQANKFFRYEQSQKKIKLIQRKNKPKSNIFNFRQQFQKKAIPQNIRYSTQLTQLPQNILFPITKSTKHIQYKNRKNCISESSKPSKFFENSVQLINNKPDYNNMIQPWLIKSQQEL